MPASADELTWARSYIGESESSDVFDERVDRLSEDYVERQDVLEAAVEESLRAQLAAMVLDQPGSASLPGGVSFSNGANIQTLAQELKTFRTQIMGSTGGIRVARLVRQRRR